MNAPLAALPMYDLPDLQGTNDRLWAATRTRLRAAGLAAPEALSRHVTDLWALWRAPTLVLAQTCGYPFRARLHDHVALVGTPDYGLEGCPPGYYRSVLVQRADAPAADLAALAPQRMAFNDALSQSGWAAPCNAALAQDLRLNPALETGSHRASALAVAEGRADWAAIDAVTWRLMSDHDPVTEHLREAGMTPPTPGLPLITALGNDPALVFRAVSGAIATLATDDLATLHLRGLVAIPAAAYLAVPNPPAP